MCPAGHDGTTDGAGRTLDDAATARGLKVDLYSCAPGEADYYGFHMNGTQHAAFCAANAARAWWDGLGPDRRYFYVTNRDGRRVAEFSGPASHAHAILERLVGDGR